MPIINRIADFHPDMTAWRHDLHAHPELSMRESRTSAVVQEKLKSFGVDEIITGLEDRFKLACPEVYRVTIHPEPVTDNTR